MYTALITAIYTGPPNNIDKTAVQITNRNFVIGLSSLIVPPCLFQLFFYGLSIHKSPPRSMYFFLLRLSAVRIFIRIFVCDIVIIKKVIFLFFLLKINVT